VSAEIREVTDANVRLTPGSRGVFDVRCDGELVFSKFQQGRFPDVGEIIQLI
jgi:selenoprotein W-related protein